MSLALIKNDAFTDPRYHSPVFLLALPTHRTAHRTWDEGRWDFSFHDHLVGYRRGWLSEHPLSPAPRLNRSHETKRRLCRLLGQLGTSFRNRLIWPE